MAGQPRDSELSPWLQRIGHELQQPLQAATLLAAALQGQLPSGEARDLAARLALSLEELRDLTATLRDWAEAIGERPFQPASVAVDSLYPRLDAALAAPAERKGLRLVLRPSGLVVRADAGWLAIMLHHLVANAIAATAAGGVLVGAKQQAGRIRIAVWDTGRGFAPQAWPALQQPLSRGHGGGAGFGLGLAIATRLAARMGLGLEAASRPGRGSRIGVIAPPADTPAAVPRPAASGGGRILLVDDNDEVREVTGLTLMQLGYAVLAASDAAAALAIIDGGAALDLLLTDIELSHGISGLQLADQATARRPGLKVLLATGFSAPADRPGLPLLHKPFRRRELAEEIAALLPATA